MGFEIDFLPVGNGDSSGDAVAVRWGAPGNYQVLIYDGGAKETGEALVQHVITHYGTTRVDHVVSSHPDGDHASGLAVVLENLHVQRLWMHRPWEHSSLIHGYFADGRMTEASLAARLQDKMRAAYDLESLARRRGIPIEEPFLGQAIGPFWVLSPQRDWYIHDLVPAFAKSPETKARSGLGLRSAGPGLMGAMALAAKAAGEWLSENWFIENLRDDVTTSAENESSVVLYGNFGGQSVLLTGDAGVQALTRSARCADFNQLDLPATLKFIQIPHHGSRHNVSTTTLDELIGPRLPLTDAQPTRYAYASAGRESKSHPRKVVVNAFLRRGFQPFATRGNTIRYSQQMPERAGWVAATPVEFSNKVEAWE
jgi:beta-lactamase superfamily II metal-dependent hydrolase